MGPLVGGRLRLDPVEVPRAAVEGPPASHGDTDEADQEGEHQEAAPDVVQAAVDEEDHRDAEEDADGDHAGSPALREVDRAVLLVIDGVLDLLEVLVEHDSTQDDEAHAGKHGSDRDGGRCGVPQDEDQQHQAAVQGLVPVDAQAGVLVAHPRNEVRQQAVPEGALDHGRVRGSGRRVGHGGSLRGGSARSSCENFRRVVGM